MFLTDSYLTFFLYVLHTVYGFDRSLLNFTFFWFTPDRRFTLGIYFYFLYSLHQVAVLHSGFTFTLGFTLGLYGLPKVSDSADMQFSPVLL